MLAKIQVKERHTSKRRGCILAKCLKIRNIKRISHRQQLEHRFLIIIIITTIPIPFDHLRTLALGEVFVASYGSIFGNGVLVHLKSKLHLLG